MKTTAHLFEAFLKCPTKCWLRATNETPTGNTHAEWVKIQNESYRVAETKRLLAQTPPGDSELSPPTDNLKVAKWRLAVDIAVMVPDLVFTQTERVEIIDGDRDRAAMDAKPSLDTGAVALICSGASGEWVVGMGIL